MTGMEKPNYERIWLQPFAGDEGGHTWCTERIEDEDIEYVRADALTALKQEAAIADRNRDAARANFITMQQAAANLLDDCEAYKEEMKRNLERARTAEAEVVRLTEANAALMSERTSLIETKREQIEHMQGLYDDDANQFKARIRVLEDALRPFANGWLDASHTAVIVQDEASSAAGNAREALVAARAALEAKP